MKTDVFLRGCGHIETLTIDDSVHWLEKKLACIARTRCAACAQGIRDKQAQEKAKRKEAKHQAQLDGHRRHVEHASMRATAAQGWTRKPPAEQGWYWWRERLSTLGMIVLVSGGKVHSMFQDSPFAESPELAGGEWFGPIREPGGDAIENCRAP